MFAITSLIDMFSFLFGPIVDRTSARFNLFFTSIVQTVSVFALLLLFVLTSREIKEYSVLLLIFLLVIYGASALIYPSGEKLIPLFAKEEELIRINSLFQTSEKVLDISFNAVSTIIISFVGLNYILVLVLLIFCAAAKMYQLVAAHVEKLSIKMENDNQQRYSFGGYLRDLRDGVREIKCHLEILQLFLPLSITNLFYGIAMVGLPVISGRYISSQAYGYGSLLMCSSLGGVFGAVLIRRFSKSIQNPRRYTCVFLLIAGIAWTLVPITLPVCLAVSYVCIFVNNCAINMMNVMFISLMQKQIDHSLLGRVSTFTDSLVSLMIPFGNMLGGILLSRFYSGFVVMLYGLALVLCGLMYLMVKE